MSDTRPLRGIVLHILRGASDRTVAGYARTYSADLWRRRGSFPRGVCLWCLKPDPDTTAYHYACRDMKDIYALGGRPPGWEWGKTIPTCARCGAGRHCRITDRPPNRSDPGFRHFRLPGDATVGIELDHRVAISIAVEMLGRKGWVRALLPGNLQWLCRLCHRDKTTEDIRTLRALQRPRCEREIAERIDPDQRDLL